MVLVKDFMAFREKVNNDLGDFCRTFNYERKLLAGLDRVSNANELFNEVKDNWCINYGGGTEVQYHLDKGKDYFVRYGIGFNFQYVPHKNKYSPVGYMESFVDAFFDPSLLELINLMKEKGYHFVIRDEETLRNREYKVGEFYLFGKEIKIDDDDNISKDDYNQMLEDMQNDMFDLYKAVFERRNQKIISEVFKISKKLLEKNKNLILTGAPGTGKTHLARNIAYSMILGKDVKNYKDLSDNEKNQVKENKQLEFIQFHPSYDYTDFVEGIRPTEDKSFERQDGIFKKFCKEALKNQDKNYVFIIDEINRGDFNKILGELFYAIDPGYRGEDGRVNTQYKSLLKESDEFHEGFYIPENVYIIGTMNDIDRSVESMDFAIRRRFAWKEITYDMTMDDILNNFDNKELINIAKERLEKLNEEINNIDMLGSEYNIGASYFLKLKDCENNFSDLWENYLYGVLFEYFRSFSKDERDTYLGKLKNIILGNDH